MCIYTFLHFSMIRKSSISLTTGVLKLETAVHLGHKAHAEFRLHQGTKVVVWSGLDGVRRVRQ